MTDIGLSSSVLSLRDVSTVLNKERENGKGNEISSINPSNSSGNSVRNRNKLHSECKDEDDEKNILRTNKSDDNVPQQIQVEIVRRWEVEKERREQMEKRNRELNKELRALRQQLKALNPP